MRGDKNMFIDVLKSIVYKVCPSMYKSTLVFLWISSLLFVVIFSLNLDGDLVREKIIIQNIDYVYPTKTNSTRSGNYLRIRANGQEYLSSCLGLSIICDKNSPTLHFLQRNKEIKIYFLLSRKKDDFYRGVILEIVSNDNVIFRNDKRNIANHFQGQRNVCFFFLLLRIVAIFYFSVYSIRLFIWR